jgi:hypothetical protein
MQHATYVNKLEIVDSAMDWLNWFNFIRHDMPSINGWGLRFNILLRRWQNKQLKLVYSSSHKCHE